MSSRARPSKTAATPAVTAGPGHGAPPPTPPPPPIVTRLKVEATATGYYGLKRRRIGDVFYIDGTRGAPGTRYAGQVLAFSKHWMKIADPDAPTRITTPQQALNQEHQAIRRMKGETAPILESDVGTPAGSQRTPLEDDGDGDPLNDPLLND